MEPLCVPHGAEDPKLIGISGRIGFGKDTLASILQETLHPEGQNYEIVPFALNVKKVVSIMTGTTLEQNLSREGKSIAVHAFPFVPDDCEQVVAILTGTTPEQNSSPDEKLKIPPGFSKTLGEYQAIVRTWINSLRVGKTLGEYQQLVGQGMRDVVQSDVWVQGALRAPAPFKIIPDVRYPGEVDAIEQNGGIVIRLERPDHLITVHDARDKNHSSEISLNDRKFKYVVQNDGTLQDLKERGLRTIADFMVEK
jgi:hypothetical protein